MEEKKHRHVLEDGTVIEHSHTHAHANTKVVLDRLARAVGHLEKVRSMVEHVRDFDYILCDSEFEALVLECSLIKQNKPKYNILLKILPFHNKRHQIHYAAYGA